PNAGIWENGFSITNEFRQPVNHVFGRWPEQFTISDPRRVPFATLNREGRIKKSYKLTVHPRPGVVPGVGEIVKDVRMMHKHFHMNGTWGHFEIDGNLADCDFWIKHNGHVVGRVSRWGMPEHMVLECIPTFASPMSVLLGLALVVVNDSN
ncbi:hypothetical protein KIPB_012353, partial [Kipferlia bialata]